MAPFPTLVENTAHMHMPRTVTLGDGNGMEGQTVREQQSTYNI